MSWFCLCNRSCRKPPSTIREMEFVRVRKRNIFARESSENSLNEGWFFPCEMCDILTSNQISYMIMLRKDIDQITFTMCNRCKVSFNIQHLHSLYHLKSNPHLELRFCTPRIRRRKVR